MKRRYTSTGFLERCRRLETALDQPAFTTDVIIGFPGETDADFEETCRVLRAVGFCKVHVFSFSPRRGTPAALLSNSVPPAIVAQRRRRLRELGRELGAAYRRRLLGRRLDVLVEGTDPDRPGWVRGTSCRAVPVAFEGHAAALIRRCVPVEAVEVAEVCILARPVPEQEWTTLPTMRVAPPTCSRVPLPLLPSV
jgi:threonylcarbamoyladenosine tRNA methylthiotransferase MtaB